MMPWFHTFVTQYEKKGYYIYTTLWLFMSCLTVSRDLFEPPIFCLLNICGGKTFKSIHLFLNIKSLLWISVQHPLVVSK